MEIFYNEKEQTFHLTNDNISYIMGVLKNGYLGHFYFGPAVPLNSSYRYLTEYSVRPENTCVFENDKSFCLEHCLLEYPSFGNGDYRESAISIILENNSHVIDPKFYSFKIIKGKKGIEGLPSTYFENNNDGQILEIYLKDSLLNIDIVLSYTIFNNYDAIARSTRIINNGKEKLKIDKISSLSLDFAESDFEWMDFSGAWGRERIPQKFKMHQGVQSISSLRGHSSHNHNPFVILKKENTDEIQGECFGISLLYSGNFLILGEIDSYERTRLTAGINPQNFSWILSPGESFSSPEAIIVYSGKGLNKMSQTFHSLYKNHLTIGKWKNKERPILINNWEATYFNFTEEKLLEIAKKAKEVGIELFVLDDGWFADRTDDTKSLGDWQVNKNLLPQGLRSLSDKIHDQFNMMFGLWFEPEMVNKNSNLYRAHPSWVLQTPNRNLSYGRNQFVLDFSNKEVTDYIFTVMKKIISENRIDYIKWDMNRSISECYSLAFPPEKQGEIYHRYILGVYDLFSRLNKAFPNILFESCASGGGRFDGGMLQFAPQTWCSDNTDAIERLKIQYGTSYCYPISSIANHVSITPNHQTNRITPLSTRAGVAYFGTFGYEMDLSALNDEQITQIKNQVLFMKKYRNIIQNGIFYRLKSPYSLDYAAWMVVSLDKKTAIVGYYTILTKVNTTFKRIKLQGLDKDMTYYVNQNMNFSGKELLNIGLLIDATVEGQKVQKIRNDFDCDIFILTAKN